MLKRQAAVHGAVPELVAAANFRMLAPGVAGSGAIASAEIPHLAGRGYGLVIDLRTRTENGVAAERAAVEAAGLRYAAIPVSGSNFDLADARG